MPPLSGDADGGPVTAQSFHPGGVICLLGDGACRFVSQTINCSTPGTAGLASQDPVSGPSPYGVWGALGSRNGGEAPGNF